ncbi:lysophospholipase Plb1 [Cordyceps fumosorosea ARSEF 2679]|uniref:Lysophospholipase n=1 Tax=Cordyceps fumosorosea (strain ARSEF 2679) TaxID=1081104 RepID=A0A168B528_CORFA|nr:lysophospholipase Plb1 [Cordyceps fumosorosea ARSEF 2679]OAA69628.1 lysophospholipase Plb1 [Cordyceps fumosorosea ARSEF 2679]
MKHLVLLLAATACLSQAHSDSPQIARVDRAEPSNLPHASAAAPIDTLDEPAVVERAINAAPSGYIPTSSACPNPAPKIRAGSSIGPDEKAWLLERRKETIPHLRRLLKRLAITGFDSEQYFGNVTYNSTKLPNIGIAISGGGYRAMIGGAGAIAAWDARSAGSEEKGNLGGLLQSATYISGLSGGDWLVGSLYVNNFTSVQSAVDAPLIWQLENSIFKGPDQYSVRGYYTDVFNEVEGKSKANFNVSASDYWGRMLAYQMVNASNGGPGYTWSSIANDTDFSNGKAPMPFLLANGRASEKTVITSVNSTVYEFTPWELGSSDPTLAGWVPLRYVGTTFQDGDVTDRASCVTGFDNAGFVMGTTSSVYTQSISLLKDNNKKYIPGDAPDFAIKTAAKLISALSNPTAYDIAEWSPNPFRGFNPATNRNANHSRLNLVDGSEDAQNVPFHPHLLPERAVDVVFAYDASSDTEYGWPDGSALVATYERAQQPTLRDVGPFPSIPDRNTLRNLGLNARPTFFGCNASNFSSTASLPPLVVWLPNQPYVYNGNLTTFTWTVRDPERAALIDNGWAVATQLNATRDTEWPACVACAVLARSLHRANATVPAQCARCFDRYCWKGNLNSSTPVRPYDPTYYGKPIIVKDSGAARRASSVLCVLPAAVMLIVAMLSL